MKYQRFQQYLVRWYHTYGRHELPWRQTTDPYAILVSELMLQQTQVERVIPKYQAFMQKFPTAKALASVQLDEVLRMWQGLGYNRRAKYLWQTASAVTSAGGEFPKNEEDLRALPGIGPYTASAVACFSYNIPVTLIETNVRTVILYHFFPENLHVSDGEILPLIKASLDKKYPREWYWALMDYGSYLKKVLPNPNRRSRQYNKQAKFIGSKRQVRGEILRVLATQTRMTEPELQYQLTSNPEHYATALRDLVGEGLVHEQAGRYGLAKDTDQKEV